ncbi:MAG TPA: hypothetical protein VGO04_08040 [Ensifer sp.]|uniref:hypothetical protein n=1 Tax=Ensifer sp. TaxID=1872086 RepID=UPI002E0FA905|nr:hypothetical protein [Ensifer sp.]
MRLDRHDPDAVLEFHLDLEHAAKIVDRDQRSVAQADKALVGNPQFHLVGVARIVKMVVIVIVARTWPAIVILVVIIIIIIIMVAIVAVMVVMIVMIATRTAGAVVAIVIIVVIGERCYRQGMVGTVRNQ